MIDDLAKAQHSDEVKATLFNLFKIWWSMAWRALILSQIYLWFMNILSYISINYLPEIIMNFLMMPFIVIFAIVGRYLIIFILFYLVIGKTYVNFRLDFSTPAPSRKRGTFKVSLRYFVWVFCILFIGNEIAQYLLFELENKIIFYSIYLIEACATILALSFIVNKSYGDFRLSLIGCNTFQPQE